MTKHKRQLLALFLVIIFFLISPLIVLYSMGYRFSNGSITTIGAALVKVSEPYADVTLIQRHSLLPLPLKKQKKSGLLDKTVFFNNVTPGQYTLLISKDKFLSWEMLITINPEKITQLDAILVPSNITPNYILYATSTRVLLEQSDKVIITPRDDLLILKNKTLHWLYGEKLQRTVPQIKNFWEYDNEILMLGIDETLYRLSLEKKIPSPLPRIATDISTTTIASFSLISTQDQKQKIQAWFMEGRIWARWIHKNTPQQPFEDNEPVFIVDLPNVRKISAYPKKYNYILAEYYDTISIISLQNPTHDIIFPIYKGTEPRIIGLKNKTLYIIDNERIATIELP